jgi:hypothetical protein
MWGGCGADVSTPRPHPRIENSGFLRTRPHTQLGRFFPAKFWVDAGGFESICLPTS